MAMATDPEWCVDMFNHYLDLNLALLQMVWDAGYTFDGIIWPDDMAYKHAQFFSLKMYRELLKPVQARAIDWAHRKGLYALLHCCGDAQPFIPDFIEIGLDGLNPLEVKAGMDPIAIKRQYGDRLVLQGGINALLYDDIVAVEAQMREIVPVLKQGGGYVCGSDHSVPSSISLQDFGRVIELAKELGGYE
jgi:uroporphyrinogen decarboxylase